MAAPNHDHDHPPANGPQRPTPPAASTRAAAPTKTTARRQPARRATPSPHDESPPGPPAGGLSGGAVDIHLALMRSTLPRRLRQLADWLLLSAYADRSTRQANPVGRHWVHPEGALLVSVYGDTAGHWSERLTQLVDLHVLQRASEPHSFYVAFRPPVQWASSVMDHEAARARHARAGAGAPAHVVDCDPSVPLSERPCDAHGSGWLWREGVAAQLPGRSDAQIEQHWQVIELFQRVFNESFKGMWVTRLSEVFDDLDMTTEAVLAAVARVKWWKDHRDPTIAPFGYLMSVCTNEPRGVQARRAPRPRYDTTAAAQPLPTTRQGAPHGTHDHDPAAAAARDSAPGHGVEPGRAGQAPGGRQAPAPPVLSASAQAALDRARELERATRR